jgi:hypothetical protein
MARGEGGERLCDGKYNKLADLESLLDRCEARGESPRRCVVAGRLLRQEIRRRKWELGWLVAPSW